MDDLTAVHDRMMANWPDGSPHVEASCQMCVTDAGGTASDEEPNGGAVVAEAEPTKTHTQADLDAAVAAAIAPLQTKLAEFDAAQAGADVDARIAAAVEPLNTQVADLQAQLDAAEVAKQAEKDRADGLVAWLEQESAAQTAAAELDARKAARSVQAKEIAGLTDEYLAASTTPAGQTDPVTNAERFAAMDDAAWQVTLDGWEAQRASAGAPDPTAGPPRRTALVASAGAPAQKSALSDAADRRIARTVDLSTLSNKR